MKSAKVAVSKSDFQPDSAAQVHLHAVTQRS